MTHALVILMCFGPAAMLGIWLVLMMLAGITDATRRIVGK